MNGPESGDIYHRNVSNTSNTDNVIGTAAIRPFFNDDSRQFVAQNRNHWAYMPFYLYLRSLISYNISTLTRSYRVVHSQADSGAVECRDVVAFHWDPVTAGVIRSRGKPNDYFFNNSICKFISYPERVPRMMVEISLLTISRK